MELQLIPQSFSFIENRLTNLITNQNKTASVIQSAVQLGNQMYSGMEFHSIDAMSSKLLQSIVLKMYIMLTNVMIDRNNDRGNIHAVLNIADQLFLQFVIRIALLSIISFQQKEEYNDITIQP
jgi:hypothetical protein